MPRIKKAVLDLSPEALDALGALHFRSVSAPLEDEDDFIDVHLVVEKGPIKPSDSERLRQGTSTEASRGEAIVSEVEAELERPLEMSLKIERATVVPREFIESMGGEAPYDRVEVVWSFDGSDPRTRLLAFHTARDEASDRRGADTLDFPLPGGHTFASSPASLAALHSAVTTFFPTRGGLQCRIGTLTLVLKPAEIGLIRRPTSSGNSGAAPIKPLSAGGAPVVFEPCSIAELHRILRERNAALGVEDIDTLAPSSLARPTVRGPLDRREKEFVLHTGEEWTAFMQSAADGKALRHFSGNDQAGILRHQRPDAAFYTETKLLEEERSAGYGIELLQQAAGQLDLDDGLAWLYISHLLAPPAPLTQGAYAGGWVDLDDVARKTMGGYARNPAEAKERRHKVWRAIRYGARAHIGGRRSVPYFDKTTGQQIETEIYTTPWQIVSRQQAGQLPLFGADEEPPVRVELVASREWTALTTEGSTAQYLPFGEVLGAIPASQAGGAWARSLGLAYINWCRRRVTEALEGRDLPSRQELLDAFPSKISSYRDILSSNDPRRALSYWQAAETILVQAHIIEANTNLYQPATRKGWAETWLNEHPNWRPGILLCPVLEALATKRFPASARDLKTPRRTRRRRDLPTPE